MMLISTLICLLAHSGSQASVNVLQNSSLGATIDGWIVRNSTAKVVNGATEITNPAKTTNPWDASFQQTIKARIASGANIVLSFSARSATRSKLSAQWEQNTEPYTKYISEQVQLTNDWKNYLFVAKAPVEIASNASHLSFQYGFDAGKFEIKNVQLTAPANQIQNATIAGSSLISNGDFANGTEGWFSEGANKPTVKLIPVTGQSFKTAAEVRFTLQPTTNAWDTQFAQKINHSINPGDVIYARAWLRSKTGSNAMFVYETAGEPYDKCIEEPLVLSPEWKEYKIAASCPKAYAPGGSQFKFFLVGRSGFVEVGPVSVQNMGTTQQPAEFPMYVGASTYTRDETAISEAKARINKIRKGELSVTVVDNLGNPITGAEVTLTQTKHFFKFGTAVPAAWINNPSADGEKFRTNLKRVFNTVTFENDLKWDNSQPNTFTENVNPATDWLKKNGFSIRGHNLVWGNTRFLPKSLQSLSPAQIREEIAKHIADYGAKMKGKVYIWDVVNEAVTERELWDKIGWEYFTKAYKQARAADPTALLCYNDYNICSVVGPSAHRDAALGRANQIKAAGAPIDFFGDQAHIGVPGTPPARLKQIWDEVAQKTGLPIEITEFDFNCRDDEYQAKYTEDFFISAFSHPSIHSIIMWGFWEGAHWLPQGASIRKDWTWRPSMTALDRLINKEWKTNVTLKTNSNGTMSLPAFYGDYTIVVKSKSSTRSISAKHEPGQMLKQKITL